VAIAGQAASLLAVRLGFGLDLPLVPAFAAVAASALLNLTLMISRPIAARLGERGVAVLLGYDLLQLAVLLYLTGGLTNPFALLMLAPVTVSATILSRDSTIALCVLAVACVTALGVWQRSLPWPDQGLALPPLYMVGVWTALVIGVLFVAVYAGSVAAEARRMSDALAATQVALAREQRLSALGGLAAAAAHELGTPLSTIAVVANEIAREVPRDGPLAADAALLVSEVGRCRDILARLAARPEEDGGAPYSRLPITVLVEGAVAPHRRDGITVAFTTIDPTARGSVEPVVLRSPEVLHGLGNLIHNAVQFARTRVDVVTSWDAQAVEVRIADDGPGLASGILERIGEPYLSTRNDDGEHMGLGIFIAATLLARTGATLELANRPGGGALAHVRWPRGRIEHREAREPRS
jgi:two-component system sensor histidine kinase RegB